MILLKRAELRLTSWPYV